MAVQFIIPKSNSSTKNSSDYITSSSVVRHHSVAKRNSECPYVISYHSVRHVHTPWIPSTHTPSIGACASELLHSIEDWQKQVSVIVASLSL